MGVTHLDAGVVIGLLDSTDAHHEAATGALTGLIDAGDRLAMAASAFAECLVGPSRRSARAVATVEHLFERLPIRIVDLDAGTARRAAALRAKHTSLRLPDAIVLAAAAEDAAEHLVTTDQRWPAPRTLRLPFSITVL